MRVPSQSGRANGEGASVVVVVAGSVVVVVGGSDVEVVVGRDELVVVVAGPACNDVVTDGIASPVTQEPSRRAALVSTATATRTCFRFITKTITARPTQMVPDQACSLPGTDVWPPGERLPEQAIRDFGSDPDERDLPGR